RVRIEQELGGIEPVARDGLVGTADAISVAQPGPRFGEVAVPDLVVALLQPDTRHLAIARRIVEQAQLDAGRVLREQREVDARPAPRCAQRIGRSRPDLDAQSPETAAARGPTPARSRRG